MSLSHRYSNFASLDANGETSPSVDVDSVEEAKLQAFEDGYQAGWEDAVKAHENATDKISADFTQNLQDMSFTFHEAFSKLAVAMKPLLSLIVTKTLPEMTNKILAARVLAQMVELMAKQSEQAIEIAVSPKNLDTLTEMLNGKTDIPFEIRGESALGDGQVYLRASTQEREINLEGVRQGISDALDAFFQQIEQDALDD